MLSNISFEEFYKEEPLPMFNDKKAFLMALLSYSNEFGSKQIHKLLFLSFVEGMVLLPFKFSKWQNGPFSEEARDVLSQLETDQFIENIPEKVFDFNKHKRILMSKGLDYLTENKERIAEIKKVINSVIEEYEEDGKIQSANYLERYCYNNFYLNSGKSQEEWNLFIKNKISDLLNLLETRSTTIKGLDDLDEDKSEAILASFDYIDNLLRKILIDTEMDAVVKGVLLKKMEEFINKWGEILQLSESSCSEIELKKLLLEIRIIFKFINEVSIRYGIFESVYGIQE